MKIRIGDNILIIAGKDRGKKGLVQRVYAERNQITVEKVNIRTKHIKKRLGQAGSRVRFEAPIDASNAIILCPNCSKPTRVSRLLLKTGKSQRVCKKCNQSLDKPIERKKTKKR